MAISNGKAQKYHPKGSAVHTPANKKGHGTVMAGKAPIRKGKAKRK